ncbi:heavy-metal-associated domain-containing protein [Carboxylicivirga sp. RSCT41]|uniref:heavy-metal-associated domain-containing protein n=1 Tax=Carboxylicivirga agarovorans TaxID=3417570 RepID=UPI003D34AC06
MKAIVISMVLMASVLVQAQDKKELTTTVFKASITCNNCKAKIMKQLPYEKGVKSVDVDVDAKLVTVSYKKLKNTDKKMNEAIKELGFESEIIGHPLSFTVKGNCDMCKQRIEEALLNVEGVNMAVWNAESQNVKVLVSLSDTTIDKLQDSVAKAGHDTEGAKADDQIYASLPECCRYSRK